MEVTIQWTPRNLASIVRILTDIYPNPQQVIRAFKSVPVADLHRTILVHVSYGCLSNVFNFSLSWGLGENMLKRSVSAQS